MGKYLILIFGSLFTGISLQMSWYANSRRGWGIDQSFADHVFSPSWASHQMPLRLALTPLIVFFLFLLFRKLTQVIFQKIDFLKPYWENFEPYSHYPYFAFYLTLLAAFGVFPDTFMIFLVFVFLNVYFFNKARKLVLQKNASKVTAVSKDSELVSRLYLPFLISGLAALIYQIVWQRELFMFFGVNIESVTVVVSVFMFGLGVGSLFGGFLSEKFSRWLPQLFLASELSIALFGFFSLTIIRYFGRVFIHESFTDLLWIAYAILFLPTLFMGATLPILVTYINRVYHNVGKSVSYLYFINTAGSAIACFITVNILFTFFGLRESIMVAVLCNITSGLIVFRFIRKTNLNLGQATQSVKATAKNSSGQKKGQDRKNPVFLVVLFFSFASGYISLSQEIIWIKILSYLTASQSVVFGLILGFFLTGIAFGSLWAKSLCEKYPEKLLQLVSVLFLVSGLGYFVFLALSVNLTALAGEGVVPIFYFAAGLFSFLIGAIFPILTQYGIRTDSGVGVRVSWVYFANILGSTLGPVVTGFVFLDKLNITENVLMITLLTLFMGLAYFIFSGSWKKYPLKYQLGSVLVLLLILVSARIFLGHFYEKLYYKQKYFFSSDFKYTVENRHGVINIEASKEGGDTILGGGIFDGKFGTDIADDHSRIDRAYMFASFHPHPQEVLEIGLSGGAWAKIMLTNDIISKMDVVEINPGYMQLIKKYDHVKDLLTDPRVRIFVDDGRRWLQRNPEKKYDFILMNTTFYWRTQINNLVSVEFLKLAKRHLKKGGVIYYNTTSSWDIPYTAAHVFKYITQYGNFIVASDEPFLKDKKQKLKNLMSFKNEKGRPVFSSDSPAVQKFKNTFLNYDMNNKRDYYLSYPRDPNLITDNNLASEYKTGRNIFLWSRNWFQLIPRLQKG